MDRDYDPEIDWKTDVLKFKDDELSFALGKGGLTRQKLQSSSGCITQYIGTYSIHFLMCLLIAISSFLCLVTFSLSHMH